MTDEYTVFTTKVEDGSYLCMSVNSPRFAVSAATEAEAKAKAKRAVQFFLDSRQNRKSNAAQETIVQSYSFEKELLCA